MQVLEEDVEDPRCPWCSEPWLYWIHEKHRDVASSASRSWNFQCSLVSVGVVLLDYIDPSGALRPNPVPFQPVNHPHCTVQPTTQVLDHLQ